MRTINTLDSENKHEFIHSIWILTTCTKYIVLLLVLLTGWSQTSFATPAVRVKLPDAVKASIRFLPGHSPDSDGRFEIEIYCVVRFDIESIEIVIGHSKEIVFDRNLPSFNGKMRAGKAKLWKLKGMIQENQKFKGRMIPASITMGIRYLYPYENGLEYVKQHYATDFFGKKISPDAEYLEQFSDYRGKTIEIIRPLPVFKPEYKGVKKQ